jgi:AcrR family transcriptional regulator
MSNPSETRPEDLLADALELRGAAQAKTIRDGRHLRTERGRAAVVMATFEMINAGGSPTIADIAAEAGISERTVFRYFPDRDTLMAAVAAELFPLIVHCVSLDRPDEDLLARLDRLIELRVELFRISGPFASSVESSAPSSQLAKDLIAVRHERLRAQIEIWLAPECTGSHSFSAPLIEVMMSNQSMGRLLEQMSEADVVATLRSGIMAMLTAD